MAGQALNTKRLIIAQLKIAVDKPLIIRAMKGLSVGGGPNATNAAFWILSIFPWPNPLRLPMRLSPMRKGNIATTLAQGPQDFRRQIAGRLSAQRRAGDLRPNKRLLPQRQGISRLSARELSPGSGIKSYNFGRRQDHGF